MTLEELNRAVREQWAKYDRALAAGLTGAPLAQIDRKLSRLERERVALLDANPPNGGRAPGAIRRN